MLGWRNVRPYICFTRNLNMYDTIRNRQLHPAFLWGGIAFVLVNPTLMFVSKSAVWIQFAKWLALG